MLTKYQEKSFYLMGKCYSFMYEVPIRWDPELKRLYFLESKRNWTFWWIGISFVLVFQLAITYVLLTQVTFFQRKGFGVIQYCMLTMGCYLFLPTLGIGYGLLSPTAAGFFMEAANSYIKLATLIFNKYEPTLLHCDKRMDVCDIFFLVSQTMNFCAWLVYIVCFVWDLEGIYWVLRDVTPDPVYWDLTIILSTFAIRTFIMLPTFLETNRTLMGSGFSLLALIVSLGRLVKILQRKVKDSREFLEYYIRLSLISKTVDVAMRRILFLTINIVYILLVQNFFIAIRGLGHLDFMVYICFTAFAVLGLFCVLIFLPLAADLGEMVIELPRIKYLEIKKRYADNKSFQRKLDMKRSKALQPLVISYGRCFPIGKVFARNILDNLIQHLMTLVILFRVSYHSSS